MKASMSMSMDKTKEIIARKNRTLALYNGIANLSWSVIGLTPVFIYCYQQLPVEKLIYFIAPAVVPVFLPRSLLQKLQVSMTRHWYERLHIHRINGLTQNGSLIKRRLAQQFGTQPGRIRNQRSINRLINQTYMFERFHWMLFVIFTLLMADALLRGQFIWGLVLLISNLVYNVCPNLLQQYLRLRLRSLSEGLPH